MQLTARIARDLLASKVICTYADSPGFNFLSDPDNIGAVEAILAPLGVRIVMTENQQAFYAAEESVEEASRQLRSQYEGLAREARRMEEIVEFMLNVFPDGRRMHIGQIIETSKVLDAINNSNALLEMLAQVCANNKMTSHTTAMRVTNLFARLAADGYLVTLSSEKETYVVTGQIEYIWDVIENFSRLIPDIAEQMPAEDKQGDLFA